MSWKQADRPMPLPVQALDHATGYWMAAAALRGLALRLRDRTATSARLSLARIALALADHQGAAAGTSFRDPTDADYADTVEATPWGAGKRLLSPVTMGTLKLHWSSAACDLGSSPAEWR